MLNKMKGKIPIQIILNVTDRGSGGQPACPGEWKMCRKKRWIVILV
jgi:hypothetical protein